MGLFILTTISVNRKSEDDLKKEWVVKNITSTKKIPYESYLKFLDGWNDKKYNYHSEDNCYFTSLDTAKDYAKSNIADINDGGLYNYVAIVEVPFDRAYAMTNVESIYIFKYVENERIYEEIPLNFSEVTKLILSKNSYNGSCS